MKRSNLDIGDRIPELKPRLPSRLFWGGLLVVFLFFLIAPNREDRSRDADLATLRAWEPTEADPVSLLKKRLQIRALAPPGKLSAEEIVAAKLTAYARNRKAMAEKLARTANIILPDDVSRFFAALEAGRPVEADKLFDAIRARHNKDPMEIGIAWRPVQEAGGANWELMNWPSQKVLDYGAKVLGSLKPGMIYLGGTDPGAFLISFLNETSEGEHHIIMTQNALADGLYLDHLTAAYGDQMKTLTQEESKQTLQVYIQDLEKRMDHDARFPDELKWVRSGENYSLVNGKPEVSGPTAVMDINEKLLHILLEKNPELTFGIEESFPFKTTYSDAAMLGPIMELRASPEERVLNSQKAAETVSYWKNQTDLIMGDSEAAASPYVLKTYSKTATSQANLLLERGFLAESEQTYYLAMKMYPGNVETMNGLLDIYSRSGRATEAFQMMKAFVKEFPEQRSAAEAYYNTRFGTGAFERIPLR